MNRKYRPTQRYDYTGMFIDRIVKIYMFCEDNIAIKLKPW